MQLVSIESMSAPVDSHIKIPINLPMTKPPMIETKAVVKQKVKGQKRASKIKKNAPIIKSRNVNGHISNVSSTTERMVNATSVHKPVILMKVADKKPTMLMADPVAHEAKFRMPDSVHEPIILLVADQVDHEAKFRMPDPVHRPIYLEKDSAAFLPSPRIPVVMMKTAAEKAVEKAAEKAEESRRMAGQFKSAAKKVTMMRTAEDRAD